MSDVEPAAPQPTPDFLEPEIALERIQALTSTARTTWLVLLGFLAFIGTMLLSVRDVDFFSVDATTRLPIVDIAIPTTTFFWTASLLAAILHAYFHVFLLKLWDALAEAPPEIGKLKLGDRVFPLARQRLGTPPPRRPAGHQPADGSPRQRRHGALDLGCHTHPARRLLASFAAGARRPAEPRHRRGTLAQRLRLAAKRAPGSRSPEPPRSRRLARSARLARHQGLARTRSETRP